MPGEDQEIVNPNMYGKALCQYFEKCLPSVGVNVSFYCNEDWGWWLEVERNSFRMALCIYSDPSTDKDPEHYAILPSVKQNKKWSWSKFRFIDISQDVLDMMAAVERVLQDDGDITAVTRHDDYPF